ncbi:MAG: T9SS type A sorting domain-containing protein [candidate division WOR-3 bacterium]|nr:T9SS type A sorting domain-containing protein [candidate division WOR-3 bacterium]MCX7836871.1 T9SS type A sorting domain-containing protein [candidate division WOR-3 bacterium]MDW8114335.1 T9SS type A sorting domain-containing protein [candidate division WOR-3 bacterium]
MIYLFVFLINFTGPVGSYLGIFQGKWALDTLSAYDTIRQFFPSETTFVYSLEAIVSESIVKETIWQGNTAYIRKTYYPINLKNLQLINTIFQRNFFLQEIQEYYDTLFEYGPYLCWTGAFYDTIIIQETIYKTPFSINLNWSLGLRGRRFILDLDGEGVPNDTVSFLADSCRVIGVENIQTPYGLIPNAYKIRGYTVMRIGASYMGYPWRDTVRMTSIDWYKDSLWLAKDSTYLIERMWFNLGIWILMAEARRVSKIYLKDIFTGIFEKDNKKIKVILWQNPLTINFEGKESEIILTNPIGQVVYKKTLKARFILDNKKYKKGIYYLKIRNKEKENLFKLVIM